MTCLNHRKFWTLTILSLTKRYYANKDNPNITIVINQKAPWVQAKEFVEAFNPNCGQEEFEKYFNNARKYIDQCQRTEQYTAWANSWEALQSVGLVFEFHKKHQHTYKIDKVCTMFGFTTREFKWLKQKMKVYALLRKYQKLAYATVSITTWITWRAKLQSYLDEHPAESVFWGGTQVTQMPFTNIGFKIWKAGQTGNKDNMHVEKQ